MSEVLVSISNLFKVFDKPSTTALQNINGSFNKGEIVGLVGPDGAGKTTLIRLIAGLMIPSSGSITVDGYDSVKDQESISHLIGYMPQKFGLYEDLSVLQNMNLYAELRGLAPEEKPRIFKELLQFTGLTPFTDRLAGALSGGMKQKLGLACALIKKPTLLLLDEPSVGVDPLSRRELWKLVHALLEQGITVIWSTAYLDEAERCHSVFLLNQGRLLYHGKPQELTKQVEGRTFKTGPIQKDIRLALVNALNHPDVIDGTIQGNDLRIVTGKPLAEIENGLAETLTPVSPRFEDSFIDILGGGPGGDSKLAETIPFLKTAQNPMIEALNLTKRFGAFTAADNITLKIQKGEIFGLLGPNGAGKTTTFKMMCGLLKPSSGTSFVNGMNLQEASAMAREHIGYMAQKFSLYNSLSVLQNLTFFSGIYNLSGDKRKQAISQMVDTFGLENYLNETTDVLSLGYKQRLALACALMHHPAVLFLDEPTSGVDPVTRREFWNHINGLVQKGVTVMVTTHFMDEAEYCDRIGLVYQSQLITTGTPDELKHLAKTKENPFPSLEDAFIQLIESHDKK